MKRRLRAEMSADITKTCPIRDRNDCNEEWCGWWDLIENQCCIVTMAKWLAVLPGYIEDLA